MLENFTIEIAERVNLREFAKVVAKWLREHPAFTGETADCSMESWSSSTISLRVHKETGGIFEEHEIVITHPEVACDRDSRFMSPKQFLNRVHEGLLPSARAGGCFAVRVWPEYSREEVYALCFPKGREVPEEEFIGLFGPERIYLRIFCCRGDKDKSLTALKNLTQKGPVFSSITDERSGV